MLLDVASIAQCVPGGELLEKLDERSFKGRVSVKLGPILLTFEGVAKFVDIDDVNRIANIEARGADKKGRGGAQARVKLQAMPEGQSTKVTILTDLQLSGSVAQIGRASGLIEEVSRQIVGEFACNLNRRVGADSVAGPHPEGAVVVKQTGSATPLSGLRFAQQVLWNVIGRILKKISGRT